MRAGNATIRNFLSRDLMDVLIRVGLIAFVVVICVWVFAPFMGLVLGALILAVALYPLHRRLANRFGGRQGRAATLFGAMGGMVSSGIIGLFIGAVMLAVGCQIFMSWVDEGEENASAESGQTEAPA